MLLIDIHSNAICKWIQTGVEFCWATQHLQKQICSTLLCTIYCLNYFTKMLSGSQSYMESNSASNWYSFQCNLLCRIQTGVEFCWVTQHLQKQICSTLLSTIYCQNYFAKMLSGPQSYMESNSASYWYSFQCNLLYRIQTGVEFCWVTQHLQKQIFSPLLFKYTHFCLLQKMTCLDWTFNTWQDFNSLGCPHMTRTKYAFSHSTSV